MKVVILAGGFGTRISEESDLKPKPMIEIGGMPILWHIMKIYSFYGFNEFVICLGYKGYMIKEYFSNYFLHTSNVTFNLKNNTVTTHEKNGEDWKVTLVDTGNNTQTGGRIKRIHSYLDDDENFFLTYGDGLANVDINNLLTKHNEANKIVTLSAVQSPGRFGSLNITGNNVGEFVEKPKGDGVWVNGGFFVVNKKVFNYLTADDDVWELDVLKKLASQNQLHAFKHDSFWQPMDTLREKKYLEELWASGNALWKVWK